MVEKLTKLYNTLALIETKGENTKLMAQCLNYTAALINECSAQVKAAAEKVGEEGGK
jgi:hypothetical protein